jgi:hypothetical protein
MRGEERIARTCSLQRSLSCVALDCQSPGASLNGLFRLRAHGCALGLVPLRRFEFAGDGIGVGGVPERAPLSGQLLSVIGVSARSLASRAEISELGIELRDFAASRIDVSLERREDLLPIIAVVTLAPGAGSVRAVGDNGLAMLLVVS